jgi:hypothetical protein
MDTKSPFPGMSRFLLPLVVYLLTCCGLSVVMACASTISVDGPSGTTTLLNHAPGTPDPNWHSYTGWEGYPIPWRESVQVTNAARGVNELRVSTNYPIVVAAYLACWGLPWTILEIVASTVALVRGRARSRGRLRRWCRTAGGVACGAGLGALLAAGLVCLMFGWSNSLWPSFGVSRWMTGLHGLHHQIGIPYGWPSYSLITLGGLCSGAILGGMIMGRTQSLTEPAT